MTGTEMAIADITGVLKGAVELADSLGLVVRVEQKPIAGGKYETVVDVRPKVDYDK